MSNWVTGREVSDTMLLSAVRRTVRRFSQFYKKTDERTCNDSDIIQFVSVCKNTRDGNVIYNL